MFYFLRSEFKNFIYFILFLVIGIIIFFYPMALSGFDLMPGDAGDASFINYTFEHYWLWLHQVPQHQSFWDMPFYYPFLNTMAWSDVLAGGSFLYIPIRFFVKNPFTAMQIWLILICIINYTLFYALLRRFKYNQLSSSVGAFLFAFGLMRYFKMCHLNYYIQYPMILSLLCMTYLKQNKHLAIGGFFAFLSLQFWSVYTLGYFFFLTIFVLGIFLLCNQTYRKTLVDFIKDYYKQLIIYIPLFLLSLAPLAYHYMLLNQTRRFDEVLKFLVDFTIWFRNESFLDSFVLKYLPSITDHAETCAGIGIITIIFAIFGIFKIKKYGKYLLITLIFFMILCSNSYLWHFVYNYVFGANGMRVISRICFIFLILYAVGIAQFFQSNKNKILTIICLIVLIAEQIPISLHTYLWSKSAYYNYIKSKSIPKNCKVLYDKNYKSVIENTFVMWIASENNIYAANGNTGIFKPPIWNDSPDYCKIKIKIPKKVLPIPGTNPKKKH